MSRLALLLKLLLTCAAVGGVAYLADARSLAGAAGGAHRGLVLAAALLLAPGLLVSGWKWHFLLRQRYPAVRPAHSFAAMLCGNALGAFTPGRVGEYAGRALSLPHGEPLQVAGLTLADRLSSLACYLAGGCAALSLFLDRLPAAPGWRLLMAAGLTLTALVAGLLFGGARLRPRAGLLRRRRWTRALLDGCLALRPGTAAVLIGLSALRFGLSIVQFLLLVRAVAPAAPAAETALAVTLVYFATTVLPSVTLMELGVREGAAVYFLGLLGVPGGAALQAALLVFAINVLTPALLGAPFLLRLRLARAAAVRPARPLRP